MPLWGVRSTPFTERQVGGGEGGTGGRGVSENLSDIGWTPRNGRKPAFVSPLSRVAGLLRPSHLLQSPIPVVSRLQIRSYPDRDKTKIGTNEVRAQPTNQPSPTRRISVSLSAIDRGTGKRGKRIQGCSEHLSTPACLLSCTPSQ